MLCASLLLVLALASCTKLRDSRVETGDAAIGAADEDGSVASPVPGCARRSACDGGVAAERPGTTFDASATQTDATMTRDGGRAANDAGAALSDSGAAPRDVDGSTSCASAGAICPEHALCVDDPDGHHCECEPDYEGDGVTCEHKCARANCDPHADCSVVEGEAHCACESAYLGDGTTCTFDGTCSALDCDEHADCVAQGEQRACVCRKGYSGSGSTCANVDECATSSPCGANQSCTDTDGSYQCTCRSNPLCPLAETAYCNATGEYSCTRDGDGCLVTGPTTACTVANECEQPTCATVTGCGSRKKDSGERCSRGVCDGAGNCVACVLDRDCSSGLICNGQHQCVVPRCGDGIVTLPAEDCDVAGTGTSNDTWHCGPDCKSRTVYTACTTSGGQCDAKASCQTTTSNKALCLPLSGNDLGGGPGVPSTACPKLSGSFVQKFWSGAFCVIECASANDCPSHLKRCDDSPFAGATAYEAVKYCVPP